MASLLTVSLHGDLPYLTQVMEELLRALMEQPSNSQPKLMLRRTESIVEKLLTNWMSICLYSFLKVCVKLNIFPDFLITHRNVSNQIVFVTYTCLAGVAKCLCCHKYVCI